MIQDYDEVPGYRSVAYYPPPEPPRGKPMHPFSAICQCGWCRWERSEKQEKR